MPNLIYPWLSHVKSDLVPEYHLYHIYPIQSVHPALVVCVAVWAAARGRGLAWEMESVSVIPDTRAVCARAARMATTERKAPTTAQEPVQVPQIQTTVSALYMYLILSEVI